MNSRWQPTPDSAPYRCSLTFQDQPGDGPFLRTGLALFPVVVDERGNRGPGRREEGLFLSPQAIREACELPGSPLVALSAGELAAERARAAVVEAERDELAGALEEAQAELDNFRRYAAAPLDGAALMAMLKPELDAEYARKTGPKPKDRSAA